MHLSLVSFSLKWCVSCAKTEIGPCKGSRKQIRLHKVCYSAYPSLLSARPQVWPLLTPVQALAKQEVAYRSGLMDEYAGCGMPIKGKVPREANNSGTMLNMRAKEGNQTTDIRSAIRSRLSVRHYKGRPVPTNILEQVITLGGETIALDSSIPVLFYLVKEGRLVAKRMTPLTGIRPLFGSAPHFIIATSEERPLFMENMGFRMEQMILYATQIGLGTCWIGGMFSEEKIATFMGLEKNQRVIALTPIGYPDTSFYGRIAHDVIELGALSFGRRKPLRQIAFGPDWGTPLQSEDSELIEALECARLAPSWANTQPWRFLVCHREVIAVADAKQRFGNIRQGKHYSHLDVGIAMAHFFLSAREMGWSGRWHVTGFDSARVAADHFIPSGYEVIGIYKR